MEKNKESIVDLFAKRKAQVDGVEGERDSVEIDEEFIKYDNIVKEVMERIDVKDIEQLALALDKLTDLRGGGGAVFRRHDFGAGEKGIPPVSDYYAKRGIPDDLATALINMVGI